MLSAFFSQIWFSFASNPSQRGIYVSIVHPSFLRIWQSNKRKTVSLFWSKLTSSPSFYTHRDLISILCSLDPGCYVATIRNDYGLLVDCYAFSSEEKDLEEWISQVLRQKVRVYDLKTSLYTRIGTCWKFCYYSPIRPKSYLLHDHFQLVGIPLAALLAYIQQQLAFQMD